MSEPVTISSKQVARGLDFSLEKVESVIKLLDEGFPVPFIARYRKDQTGNLDETQIREVESRLNELRQLAERKQVILKAIESLGKLTPELDLLIREAKTSKRLEDLYLPYKPKRETLASTARSRGLEPLAQEILDGKLSQEKLNERIKDFIDADKGVKDVFDFYFELPYRKPAKDDDLIFKPAVSKLDVIFNMDTTGSMGGEVNNLKGRIRDYIYPQIRMRVGDSGFGVTYFEDFPVNGYGAAGDLPYRLLGAVSTNPDVITAAVNQLTVRNGGDGPESGYESLWQIVMGNDRSYPQAAWSSTANGPIIGSIPYYDPAPGTWGGVGFRDGTLPVVVHITDVVSHDHNQNPYDTRFVRNPHYSTDVHPAYQAKGARVVSIYRNSSGVQLGQLVGTSQVTNAIVPACAFKQPSGAWRCGENRCCTVTSASGVAPIAGNSCVLSYGISSSGTMSDTLVEGIDALVKYGTYEVSTVIHGEPIRDMHGNLTGKDTSCFIKRVESVRYIAPEQEPEMSCNPVAVPTQVGGVGYNNGFANFAPGTSNAARPGAQLVFRVVAENDTCFAPEKTARSFKAYIDVVNPTTGLLFGRREVVIIVPGEINIVPG